MSISPVFRLTWLGMLVAMAQAGNLFARPADSRFAMVEISFRPIEKSADPFAEDFWGWVADKSGHGTWIPAFYDGAATWKLRFSPRTQGDYQVAIYVEKSGVRHRTEVTGLQPATFAVTGAPVRPGVIHLQTENPRAFQWESGEPYYPIGLNLGWDSGAAEVRPMLEKLAAAGGNWTRIWMCHWDGKNLDWVPGGTNRPGEFDLQVARKWDEIVSEAERLRLAFQLVLQHHGQFSTTVNPNWNENPWNRAKGGFLEKPEDFFASAHARELTRRKYRYLVARYGYSSAILAWELFNEVEFTDAAKTPEGRGAIREWHEEMAAYIRSLDPNHHLITTSAPALTDPIWAIADFYQQHAYPPDALAGSGGFEIPVNALAKPIFYGEIGSTDPSGSTAGDGGKILRDVLWGGFFSGAGAGAQYWAWDQVEREQLFPLIQSATEFAHQSGFGEGGWRRVPASVTTAGRADLVFGPGQRWNSVVDPHLKLATDGSGRPEGVAWSATLRPHRGSGEQAGTDTVSFQVQIDQPSRWEVTVNEVGESGARIELEVDGQMVRFRDWEKSALAEHAKPLPETLGVDLPSGARQLRIRSTGADYFQVASIRLQHYGPELGVRAMTNDLKTVAWIYRESTLGEAPQSGGPTAGSGRVTIENLFDGNYRLRWWDTVHARVIREDLGTVKNGRMEFATVPIATDVALLIEPQEGKR